MGQPHGHNTSCIRHIEVLKSNRHLDSGDQTQNNCCDNSQRERSLGMPLTFPVMWGKSATLSEISVSSCSSSRALGPIRLITVYMEVMSLIWTAASAGRCVRNHQPLRVCWDAGDTMKNLQEDVANVTLQGVSVCVIICWDWHGMVKLTRDSFSFHKISNR